MAKAPPRNKGTVHRLHDVAGSTSTNVVFEKSEESVKPQSSMYNCICILCIYA